LFAANIKGAQRFVLDALGFTRALFGLLVAPPDLFTETLKHGVLSLTADQKSGAE